MFKSFPGQLEGQLCARIVRTDIKLKSSPGGGGFSPFPE